MHADNVRRKKQIEVKSVFSLMLSWVFISPQQACTYVGYKDSRQWVFLMSVEPMIYFLAPLLDLLFPSCKFFLTVSGSYELFISILYAISKKARLCMLQQQTELNWLF